MIIFVKVLENSGTSPLELIGLNNSSNNKSSNKNIVIDKQAFSPKFSKNELILATFNVEWLGDGINDRKERTEQDYKIISKIMSEMNADILGLQEIENEATVKKILKYLKGYKYQITKNKSAQNVAFLYNSKLKIKRNFVYDKVDFQDRSTRPALVIEAQKGNFDFVVANIHLKSTSHYDNTVEKRERSFAIRTKQAEEMSNFADSILSSNKEHDVFILGDFNDTPVRKKNPTLMALQNNANLTFLTGEMKSCKSRSLFAIDHIVASKQAQNRFVANSERSYDINIIYGKEAAKNISDHCPVLANFDILAKDND